MAKKRVHEVAKELGLKASVFLEEINSLGIEKSSNFNALEDDEITKIMEHYKAGDSSSSVTAAAPSKTTAAEPKPKVVPAQTAVAEAEPEPEPENTPEPAAEAPTEAPSPVQEQPKVEVPSTESDISEDDLEELIKAEEDEKISEAEQQPVKKKVLTGDPRPPVVAVLGHVDHGKTTLLDQIRSAKVVDGEAGGITQAIGAYQVEYNGHKITFIDTPGHRAFTGMRARGAQVTDIIILVVAADDGIMEQTKEAISHAKAANVPIIIAINKMDRPGADPMKVKQQLSEHDLMTEEWGGNTITVETSALNGEGIDDLLEMIILVTELEELKADPKAPVDGTIIESHLDPGRGAVATAIISNGTLRERDVVVSGSAHGRIRALLDERGGRMTEVLPGSPVQILGFSEAPAVGGSLEAYDNPGKARKAGQARKDEARIARMTKPKMTWDDLMAQAEEKGILNLILKAESRGSLEALQSEVQLLDTDEISLNILHTGVGNIGESDVLLGSSANDEVIVFGFEVELDGKAKELADQENVTVKTYKIIYELIDDLKKAHRSMMEPNFKEVALGVVEIREVYKITKVGAVAGCIVRDGVVKRNALVKVMRGEQELFDGRLESLKRFENDVREVSKDTECGIKLDGFNDIEVGDMLNVYALEEIERI
jgi:translation initiation factor IF-2